MRITRRQALGELLVGAGLLATACGDGQSGGTARSGSTLISTWADPAGTGVLQPSPGEPLLARTDLGPRRAPTRVLATLAHITDAHVLDASSPARVTFLDRLGPPFQSTFRPHETLTAQVLAGATRAVRELRPDAVIQGGDLIDNDQSNELAQALAVLRGGAVRPGSGPHGYFGVQLPSNPDPFYYRPDLDAPQYPGLLRRATREFRSPGLDAPWYPVLGDHDILVAGEIAPTAVTRQLATGGEALWELPPGLQLPPGTSLTAGSSPDGPPSPELVDRFLAQAVAGSKVRVPTDGARRELDPGEVMAQLREASGLRGAGGGPGAGGANAPGGRLEYHADVGPHLRMIVLDLARREGGSGGLVTPDQPAWLASELAAAGERWVIVVSHQPLVSSEGGDRLLALLDRSPRVIATLAGHTHRNRIEPRASAAGGYWQIETASLIDYPQQARAIRLLATEGGGVALETWMLDHVFGGDLGQVARQLSFLDAQGGRPQWFTGRWQDRNVSLYRA